jgi:hypothetical protein
MADMAKIMSVVREYSDARLADVLAGKDMSVPQFAAMTEAMGRKQLRQAVDGQQAMQQAQQPSVKDQLLAEQQAEQAQMGGIAALPAPNMEAMGEGMAGGGIVAFADTGVVGPSKAKDEWESLKDYDPGALTQGEGWGSDISNFFSRSFGGGKKIDPETGNPISFGDFLRKQESKSVAAAPAAPAAAPVVAAAPAAAPAAKDDGAPPTVKDDAAPASGGDDKKGIAKLADRVSYLDSLQGVGKDIRGGIADIKNAKQSDVLLAASKALLGNATLAKAGSDFSGSAIELGGKSRKEINELTKVANDYDFNLAKAREAAAQGNDELAYKYEALAEQAKYRAGVLGLQGQKLGMMQTQYNDIKVPAQLSKVYADAKKEVDAAYNNMVPASKRAQYQKDIDAAYRKRAGAVGLGKYVDTYSPGAPAYNVVQSPRKGAQTLELDEV